MKRLRGPLLIASIASVILHLGIIVEDIVSEWLWLPDHEEAAVRATKKKLKAQDLDSLSNTVLQKVKPAERLTVTLRQRIHAVAVQQPAPLTEPPKRKSAPKPKPIRKPEVLASAVQAQATPESKVAVASEPAAPPVEVASEPMPVTVVASAVESQPTEARKPSYSGVSRFPHDVSMTYRWGFYVAEMRWHVENGKYDLTVEASGMGLFYRFFESRGSVGGDGVRPDQFVEYRERDHRNPKYVVDFDYVNKVVEVGEPGKRKTEPMTVGDHDIFSAAFHLALTGADEKEAKMAVYTGRRRYPDVQFEVAGESTLSLAGKDFDAVLLRGKWENRRFEFWLAPQWHNIPVRMNIVVPEYGSFDFWAQDIKLDGKTVLEWNPQTQD